MVQDKAWVYDYDEANQDVHIFDANSNEIGNSPVDVSNHDGLEVPGDLINAVAQELQDEINSNQDAPGDIILTDRAMKIIGVLAAPDRRIDAK